MKTPQDLSQYFMPLTFTHSTNIYLCICYMSSPVTDTRVTLWTCRDPTLSYNELERSTLDKCNICEVREGWAPPIGGPNLGKKVLPYI